MSRVMSSNLPMASFMRASVGVSGSSSLSSSDPLSDPAGGKEAQRWKQCGNQLTQAESRC